MLPCPPSPSPGKIPPATHYQEVGMKTLKVSSAICRSVRRCSFACQDKSWREKPLGSILLILFLAVGFLGSPPAVRTQAAPAVQTPVLKWQNGGCYSSWCETGWYSSPAVGDIDGDDQPEVIASAYSIVALDGASGA